MIRDECIGDVLPGQAEKGQVAARMVLHPISHIVHLPLDGDPEIGSRIVLPQLGCCDVILLLRSSLIHFFSFFLSGCDFLDGREEEREKDLLGKINEAKKWVNADEGETIHTYNKTKTTKNEFLFLSF